MKKTLGILIVIALATTPLMAQKITIDYAHDYDFGGGSKTFQYVETKESDTGNSMMNDRIATLIKKEISEGGSKEVSENPDFYATYHFTSEENTTYNTTNFGYGGYGGGWGGYGRYGGGYYRGGMGSSTTTASTYTVGTLIIDAYDAAEKKLIWRGTGTVTVKSKPEKQIKQVEKILAKLGTKWDKIQAGMGE